MSGTTAFITGLLGIGLPLLLAIAWIVFVVRQRDWQMSNRIVAGIVGSLVILVVTWSILFYFVADLVGGGVTSNAVAPLTEVPLVRMFATPGP